MTFPTQGRLPSVRELASWLIEQGEAFDDDGDVLALKALELRLVRDADGLTGWIEVECDTPLPRLVDLLFALSVRAGADVKLAGTGLVTRSELWMRLADEQDRLRLATALDQAVAHGNADDVQQRLWALLQAIRPGHDVRWDAAQKRVVELVEVGTAISVEDARWLKEGARAGDVVARPIEGTVHLVAWRYVSQAWPGLLEED